MNGNWEISHSAYPIGFLRDNMNDTPMYHLTDMRELKKIDARPVTLSKAEAIAATVNKELRSSARGIDIAARVSELISEA